MESAIVIRDIDGISEMRAVEDLQKEIWGVEDLEIFPAMALVALKEVGAVFLVWKRTGSFFIQTCLR
jgi:predicted GNAT superfamily acetyltransferase